MSELPKTKTELSKLRVDLIERVAKEVIVKTRMELQLQLTAVNAEIKRLNKLASADAQRDAAVRKALGRAEAEANAKRAEEQQPEPGDLSPALQAHEAILIKAKQLMRDLGRFPRPYPAHFGALSAPLADFIEAQKAVMKGELPTSEPVAWHETWSAPK